MTEEAYSPTSLETFARCERKWGWAKIDGIREPPSASMALGSAVHSLLEDWLLKGVPPSDSTREGLIARSGLHHLPPPGHRDVHVEKSFRVRHEGTGLLFTGRIDVVDARVPYTIIDHKTTSNINRYAKTEASLYDDLQAGIYAWATGARNLRWVYYQTASERSKAVDATLTDADVEQIMFKAVALATRIRAIRNDPRIRTALQLAPNPNACGDYHGCPHIHRCNLSTAEKVQAIMSTGIPAEGLAFLASLGKPAPGQINPPSQGPSTTGLPPGVLMVLPTGQWISSDGTIQTGPLPGAASPQPQPQPQAQPSFAAPPSQPSFAAPPSQPSFAAPPSQPSFAAPQPQSQPSFAAPQPAPAAAEPAKRRPGRPRKNTSQTLLASTAPVQTPAPAQAPESDDMPEWVYRFADGLRAFADALDGE